jgi:UTP-glucose-1-phosphate uridylyltransferase
MTAVRHLLIPAAGLGTRMRVVDAEVICLYQEVLPETLLR